MLFDINRPLSGFGVQALRPGPPAKRRGGWEIVERIAARHLERK